MQTAGVNDVRWAVLDTPQIQYIMSCNFKIQQLTFMTINGTATEAAAQQTFLKKYSSILNAFSRDFTIQCSQKVSADTFVGLCSVTS